MSALYGTGRLLWRPAIVLALFPLGLVTGLAFLGLPSDSPVGEDPAVRATAWRFATIVPAGISFLVSLLVRELQHTLFAWSLPDLAGKLLRGKLVLGGLVATGVALGSFALFDAQSSIALFGWSLLSYSAGGVMFDPVRPKSEALGAAILLVIVAFRPLHAAALMEPQPLVAAVVLAASAVVLMRREFGRSLSRMRPLTFTALTWSSTPRANSQYWARTATSEGEWSGAAHRWGTIDWIRAGAHELFGARRGGFVVQQLVLITIIVVTGHFTDNLAMAAMFPWIFVGMHTLQLSSRFLYPVSRAARAKLFFVGALAESAIAAGSALAAIGALLMIGPRTDWMSYAYGSPGLDAFMSLAFFVALAPIGHWAKIRGSYFEQAAKSTRLTLRYFAFQMTFLFLAAVAAVPMQELDPSTTMSVAAGLFVLIHGLFWLALRRHFGRADLVVARA